MIQALLLLLLLALALIAAVIQAEALPELTRDVSRWSAAVGLLLAYGAGLLWWRARPRDSSPSEGAETAPPGSTWLLAYASQTGTAAEIAQRSAAALRSSGQTVDLRDLGSLDFEQLSAYSHALLVIATTGEGEAPESALGFVREVMVEARPLPGLQTAVLALGDRDYPQFCAFGHAVQAWLQQSGSCALHPVIEVDAGDPQALAQWHALLQSLAGGRTIGPVDEPSFEPWILEQRQLLNPGSLGLPICLLRLRPQLPQRPTWSAGAIASLKLEQPPERLQTWLDALAAQGADFLPEQWQALERQAKGARLPALAGCQGLPFAALIALLHPLPQRDYSIASTAADGVIDLVLRETRTAQGELGLGAAWLCRACPIGHAIELHVRENPQFGLPPKQSPLILIGAGTGIAGLRGLLRARLQAGATANWLIFGERQRHCDALFDQELQHSLENGGLQRLDQVYSREQNDLAYVQDVLARQAERLRLWIEQGAHLRICGSADTMGKAVDQELQHILGDSAMAALTASGRCRKDVY